MDDLHYERGVYFLTVSWTLTVIAVAVITLRIYSRTWLTRSLGSDDVFIFISLCLTLVGISKDTLAVRYGLGRHTQLLDNDQYSQEQRWEFIGWLVVFISYFFIRASVMLFVLRLLPPYKIWQQRVILVTFFLNFAITMIATVSYGVRCIPFTAIYKSTPNAKCLPENVVIATQQVNGVLACLIDIATAMIPLVLLWGVKMRRKTKLTLNIIFGLGLVTAGLSIGRAATSNNGIYATDTTWRIMPSNTFSMFEEKCGLIFASAPAVRQFFAYCRRAGTALPTNRRQPPNADFVSMRLRINVRDFLRDTLWYRRTSIVEGRAKDARSIFWPRSNLPDTPASSFKPTSGNSPLDFWETKIKSLFKTGSSNSQLEDLNLTESPAKHADAGWLRRNFSFPHLIATLREKPSNTEMLRSTDEARAARLELSKERGLGWPGLAREPSSKGVAGKYQAWGLPLGRDSEGAKLNDASAVRGESRDVEAGAPLRSSEDAEFAEVLAAGASPVHRPAPGQKG